MIGRWGEKRNMKPFCLCKVQTSKKIRTEQTFYLSNVVQGVLCAECWPSQSQPLLLSRFVWPAKAGSYLRYVEGVRVSYTQKYATRVIVYLRIRRAIWCLTHARKRNFCVRLALEWFNLCDAMRVGAFFCHTRLRKRWRWRHNHCPIAGQHSLSLAHPLFIMWYMLQHICYRVVRCFFFHWTAAQWNGSMDVYLSSYDFANCSVPWIMPVLSYISMYIHHFTDFSYVLRIVWYNSKMFQLWGIN